MKVNIAANIRLWRTANKNPTSKEPDAQAGAERRGERGAIAMLNDATAPAARPFDLKLGIICTHETGFRKVCGQQTFPRGLNPALGRRG